MSQNYMNNLKPLRLFCALAVIYSHSFSVASGSIVDEPLLADTGLSVGNYAVIAFFSISGILIPQSIDRNSDFIYFWSRRFLRILPALFASTVFTAFILGPCVTELSLSSYFLAPELYRYIAGSLSLLATSQELPGVFSRLPDAGEVNVPLWTLKYEILVYALSYFLFCGIIVRFILRVTLFAAVLLFLFFLQNLTYPAGHGPLENVQNFILSFFISAFLSRSEFNTKYIMLIFSLSTFALIALYGYFVYKYAAIVSIASATQLIARAQPLPIVSNERMGDYSYGFYVFAFPLQQLCKFSLPELEAIQIFTLSTIFCLPVAMVSWHLIEKPALVRISAH